MRSCLVGPLVIISILLCLMNQACFFPDQEILHPYTLNKGDIVITIYQGDYDYDYVKPADIDSVILVMKTKSPSAPNDATLGASTYIKKEKAEQRRKDRIGSKVIEIFSRVRGESLRLDQIFVNPQMTYAIAEGNHLVNLANETVTFTGSDHWIPGEMAEWSPDGKFVAIRYGNFPWESDVVVIEAEHNQVVYRENIGNRIDALAWSPDSKHLAILYCFGDDTIKSPFDIIGGCSGHPSTYYTFWLAVFDLDHNKVFETEIVKDIRNGGGIVGWVGDE